MNRTKNRSLLLMAELVLSLLAFALCMTVCLRLVLSARALSIESSQKNQAVFWAANGAEAWAATDTLEEAAAILEGEVTEAGLIATKEGLTLTLTESRKDAIKRGEIQVRVGDTTLYTISHQVVVPKEVFPDE